MKCNFYILSEDGLVSKNSKFICLQYQNSMLESPKNERYLSAENHGHTGQKKCKNLR